MITVKINNSSYEFSKDASLKEVIDHLKIEQTGIAVAINESIVPKPEWLTKKVQTNDNILIIKATQGG